MDAVTGQAFHGVTLLFVVSDVTLTVQAGRRHDGWVAYAIRRIARVGPGYWLAGLCHAASAGLTLRLWAPDGVGPGDLGIAAAFGSAWQGGASMAVVPGGWSVCCEVAFYAALPVLLWLIGGRLWRAVRRGSAGRAGPGPIRDDARRLELRSAVYQFGRAGSCVPGRDRGGRSGERVRLPRPPGLSLAFLALAVFGIPFLGLAVRAWLVLPHLPFAALAAGVVALAAQHPPRLLASAPMRQLGEVSHSLYLVHFAFLAPCLAAAEWLIPAGGPATLTLHYGLTAAVSFGVACSGYRWVEQPSIQWAGRLVRRRSSGIATPE